LGHKKHYQSENKPFTKKQAAIQGLLFVINKHNGFPEEALTWS
jgi:hypothetical protein